MPFDVPLVTHDMLLRFTSTDMISAAGTAAQVPSRIGEETEAVISETHPNGTAIEDIDASMEGSLDLEGVVPAVKSGAENVRDAYYNVGSAAVILFLVLAVVGIFFCLRARVRKDSAARSNLGYYEARPSSSSRRSGRRGHKRGNSSVSTTKPRHSTTSQQDPLELAELVKHEDWDAEAAQGRSGYVPTVSGRRNLEEEVFSLGDSDEDLGGDIGRVEDTKETIR